MGYGIILKSFGKAPDNSDKNKEITEKKKALLQQQFQKQTKELSKNNITIIKEEVKNEKSNISIKYKEQLKEFRHQIKTLKLEKTTLNKKVKMLEKKNITYIKDNQNLNKKIEDINNQLSKLEQKYTDSINEYNLLKEKYKDATFELFKLNRDMSKSNVFRRIHRELEKFSVENKKIRFEIGAKEKTITKLIKDLDSLRLNKLGGYTEVYKQTIEKLENDKNSLAIENQKLKRKLEVYEPSIEEKKEVAITIEENNLPVKFTLVEITESTGILKKVDDKYYYEDYDGNIFENIDTSKFYIKDLEKVYCLVEYNKENDLYIVKDIYPFIRRKEELVSYLYEMNLRRNNELKFYKKRKSVKKEYVDYSSFNNQKVLIVNSFNPSYYMTELNKYSLKVENFNTYEENPQKIIPKLKSYDIVICCTGTSRHYMNTLIENAEDFYKEDGSENVKYQFIENVTLTNLLNRINYTIENI